MMSNLNTAEIVIISFLEVLISFGLVIYGFKFLLGISHLKNFMWKPATMEQMMSLSSTACPQRLPSQVFYNQI